MSLILPHNVNLVSLRRCAGKGGGMSESALRKRVVETIYVVLPKVLSLDTTDAAAKLSESTNLMDDLGMTSTVTMELILELEDALEIQIDVEEMEPADLASISVLTDYVVGHMVVAD
jgi:acyl carrier protein